MTRLPYSSDLCRFHLNHPDRMKMFAKQGCRACMGGFGVIKPIRYFFGQDDYCDKCGHIRTWPGQNGGATECECGKAKDQ
jgi:hypothetical protein